VAVPLFTPRRSSRAFTLIELLVSIGVIGILSMMILPVLTSARRQARYALCESNLRQVGGAIHAYINYTGGIMPIGNDARPVSPGLTQPTNHVFVNDGDCRWNGPTGLGILIAKGYFDDAQVLYQSGSNTCGDDEMRKFRDGPSTQGGAVACQFSYLHGGLGRGADLPKLSPARSLVMDWQGYRLVGGVKTDVTFNHDATACHILRADGSVNQYIPESKEALLDNLNGVSDARGAFDFADNIFH
jgi:prepilin-type N-terminal cleavage/methylation domain-containing protein